jgi:hypothetical protein
MTGTTIPTATFGFFQQFKINYLHDRRCIAAVCGLLCFLRGVSRYHYDPRPLPLPAVFCSTIFRARYQRHTSTSKPKPPRLADGCINSIMYGRSRIRGSLNLSQPRRLHTRPKRAATVDQRFKGLKECSALFPFLKFPTKLTHHSISTLNATLAANNPTLDRSTAHCFVFFPIF